jgi:glycosyltransferase involved in cell wall biosynthesis
MIQESAQKPLHIISIATLFPSTAQPNFGLFVDKSLAALAQQPDMALQVIAPVGLPPWPLSRLAPYRKLDALPLMENWGGLTVYRPRFCLIPRLGGRINPAMIARAVLPLLQKLHAQTPVDVLDAQFFYPDGPAAQRMAQALNIPFSIKARGADISFWPHQPGVGTQIQSAATAATGLLAVSEALKADMMALGMAGEKIRVHYTGIDAARFCILPHVRAARPEQKRILTVGALIPRKGQELVIRALPNLPDVAYVLAGAGAAEGAYRTLAQQLGVADRVQFLGPVANADLPALYNAVDAVVMPSASEGLANAWVEALACGTPIVISDAGGAGELVSHADAGRIVARTPDAIALAVADILAQTPAPENVAATLAGRFSWDKNGAELAQHLRGLCRDYSG